MNAPEDFAHTYTNACMASDEAWSGPAPEHIPACIRLKHAIAQRDAEHAAERDKLRLALEAARGALREWVAAWERLQHDRPPYGFMYAAEETGHALEAIALAAPPDEGKGT